MAEEPGELIQGVILVKAEHGTDGDWLQLKYTQNTEIIESVTKQKALKKPNSDSQQKFPKPVPAQFFCSTSNTILPGHHSTSISCCHSGNGVPGGQAGHWFCTKPQCWA
uniref:Uncharacterized protein n=1 Tax=Poecilia reticulata TaxID=8081 RepID=A0A3P9P3U8_POERE